MNTTVTLPADLPVVPSPPMPWRITCRVHLLPCPSNTLGVWLCETCMSGLDAAAEFIAELRAMAELSFVDAICQFDAELAHQDDKVQSWWRTMDEFLYHDSLRYQALCSKARELNGRGAIVVRARQALDDAARATVAVYARCDAAMVEIEKVTS